MAKPSFCRGIPITDCLTVVQCKVHTLTLNRPISFGFTVLELSKLHMYKFHYQHMKVKYPCADQLRLLFTDTDSLAYAVKTNSVYEDMAADASEGYDFSEYLYDHPLYDASNRKALGYFKDELNSHGRVSWLETQLLYLPVYGEGRQECRSTLALLHSTRCGGCANTRYIRIHMGISKPESFLVTLRIGLT